MKLEQIFEQSHLMPNIPKIVQDLIASFEDTNVDVDEIAKKIALDQVITAKVLRLANSARYGLPRQVASVDDAVVLLGFNALRTLVIASGVTGSTKDIPGFDKENFWKHSFTTAAIAKHFAKDINVNPETAFTCGMLHNIGELLLHVVLPNDCEAVDQVTQSGGNRSLTQKNRLGYDYADVGKGLAQTWKFPEEVVSAIGNQVEPDPAKDTLASLIFISAILADASNKDKSFEEIATDKLNQVADHLSVSMEALQNEISKVKDETDSFMSLIN